MAGDRQKVWCLLHQGKSINEICELMGLSHGTVQRIVQGQDPRSRCAPQRVLFGTGGETDQGTFPVTVYRSTTYVGFRMVDSSDAIHGYSGKAQTARIWPRRGQWSNVRSLRTPASRISPDKRRSHQTPVPVTHLEFWPGWGLHGSDPWGSAVPSGFLRVADHTDEGPGGDSQRPIMNDNVLYHSLLGLAGQIDSRGPCRG